MISSIGKGAAETTFIFSYISSMRFLIALFVGLSPFLVSSQVPTWGEIYDFEIGDIFHYLTSPEGFPPTYSSREIMGVNYSLGNDTVNYVVLSQSITLPACQNCPYNITSLHLDTIVYISLLDTIQYGPAPDWNWDTFCVTNFDEYTGHYLETHPEGYESSCSQFVYERISEPITAECVFELDWTTERNHFAAGYGSVLSTWFNVLSGIHSHRLIYSSKNGVECGEAYDFTSDIVEYSTAPIIAFPNPSVNGHFRLNERLEGQLLIYDLSGKLVHSIQLFDEQEIDLSALGEGLFLGRWETTNGQSRSIKFCIAY